MEHAVSPQTILIYTVTTECCLLMQCIQYIFCEKKIRRQVQLVFFHLAGKGSTRHPDGQLMFE